MRDDSVIRSPRSGQRADARRNRQRILDAARDLVAERGAVIPFDAVGERAGVGNATLYRHFASRDHLMRAVALDVLTRSEREARAAAADLADPFAALARYMHVAIDIRVAAVMPILARVTGDDDGVREAAASSAAAMQHLIDAAVADGSLDPAVAFGDVGLLLIRLSRPIAPFSGVLNNELAHRHLDIVLRGFRVAPDGPCGEVLPAGPALEDLRDLATSSTEAAPQAEMEVSE